jgi:HEAT repeat protein
MRSLLVPVFAALLGSTAWAGELRQPVLDQLAGVESAPTAEALQALGDADAVRDELIALSKDDTLPRSHRLRALHALGWFPSDASRAVLNEAVAGADHHAARKAVYALGIGWKDGALPELTHALQANDTQLRIAAAKALGEVATPGARQALEARLPAEPSDTVKEQIQKSLAPQQ